MLNVHVWYIVDTVMHISFGIWVDIFLKPSVFPYMNTNSTPFPDDFVIYSYEAEVMQGLQNQRSTKLVQSYTIWPSIY